MASDVCMGKAMCKSLSKGVVLWPKLVKPEMSGEISVNGPSG